MFYYISFLRPPPVQVSFTDPVLITPQICNDLRTEYFYTPIDIYYAWSPCTPHPAPPTIATPTKLTSWRTTTAYKEIPVPRPPLLDAHTSTDSDGPSWRLILTCGKAPSDQVVVLGDTDTTGNTPFAVTSMPVHFTRRQPAGNNKGTKQERIMRSYTLRVPVLDPIVFDIAEQTSFDLDKKIWDSGIGLSSWLVQLFSRNTPESHEPLLSDLRASLFSTDARHILELGAGTGVVAITLAVLRSTLEHVLEGQHQPGASSGSIVTTDLPSAMPILRHNIASNRALMSSGCIPEAAVLDWDDEDLAPPVQAQLEAGLDVIVMADVTYNTASFPALIDTLARLIQRCKQKHNGHSPRILMGYKERHPDERSLWDRAKKIDLCFQQIAQVDGAGGNPVEIWLG